MDQKSILLFDGVCNLCNRSVQFIIKRDKEKRFLFASLQGKAGQELLSKFYLPINDFNSFVLLENDRVFTKSTGVLKAFKKLSGGWRLCYVFIIVPKFIRDAIYTWIAKHRYKWFGKNEKCMVPTPELKGRFLE